MAEIHLSLLTKDEVTTLSGQERGRAARELFKLDELDASGERVIVRVPTNMEALTPSFLQGMFSVSVRKLGGSEAFLAQYIFDAPVEILQQVDRAIRNSLIDRDNLFH